MVPMTPEARRAHLVLCGKTFLDEWRAMEMNNSVRQQSLAIENFNNTLKRHGVSVTHYGHFHWELSNGEMYYHYAEPNI